MSKRKHTEAQIIAALKQLKDGNSRLKRLVANLCTVTQNLKTKPR